MIRYAIGNQVNADTVTEITRIQNGHIEIKNIVRFTHVNNV